MMWPRRIRTAGSPRALSAIDQCFECFEVPGSLELRLEPDRDRLGWGANSDGERRDVFRDECAGTDDRTIADRDATENDRTGADPDVSADVNRVARSLCPIADPRRRRDRNSDLVHLMITATDDLDVPGNEAVVPDEPVDLDMSASSDGHMGSQAEAVRRRDQRTTARPEVPPDLNIRSYGSAVQYGSDRPLEGSRKARPRAWHLLLRSPSANGHPCSVLVVEH